MNDGMIRRLVYAFKRQWGRDFTYVQIESSTVDDSTGRRNIQRSVFEFPAVILPISTMRKFIQDIGYLAANKNFTYGALNDLNKLNLLISADDFPLEFKPDLNGYVNYGGKRYERVSIENLFDAAYVLTVQGVEGANPYAILNVRAESVLQLSGRVVHELN